MIIEEILEKYIAGNRDFTDLNLFEANLSGINLSGANLSGVNLSVANLSGANLTNANLSKAKLNIAKLNGAHLIGANLNEADLNVANLVLVNLKKAQLIGAKLIRAELIRANLSEANLTAADLNGASLPEANLSRANLSGANFRGANLKKANLSGANLVEANLQGVDLSGASLEGADLRGAELRQVNLTGANLKAADLSGVNLRWAMLSSANLRLANLSDAKLSGADLSRSNLSNTNLLNASLVHADLSNSYLLEADWIGADLTGAILTGAKIYGVSRLGIKTEDMTCEWVDLSPYGDKSQVYHLGEGDEVKSFFHETLPTVKIVIDAPIDNASYYALATVYYHIGREYPELGQPPSIEVSSRKTTISLMMNSDRQLFANAYAAIIPFYDAAKTQENLVRMTKQLQTLSKEGKLDRKEIEHVRQIHQLLDAAIKQVKEINVANILPPKIGESTNFFHIPTKMVVINSSNGKINVYHHPTFGKPPVNQYGSGNSNVETLIQTPETKMHPASVVREFIKGFHNLNLKELIKS